MESPNKNSAEVIQIYRLINNLYVYLDYIDRDVLAQFNVTTSHFNALRWLDTDQGQRLITLTERLLLDKSSVTRIVDQL